MMIDATDDLLKHFHIEQVHMVHTLLGSIMVYLKEQTLMSSMGSKLTI